MEEVKGNKGIDDWVWLEILNVSFFFQAEDGIRDRDG